jgi:hypothetical protein
VRECAAIQQALRTRVLVEQSWELYELIDACRRDPDMPRRVPVDRPPEFLVGASASAPGARQVHPSSPRGRAVRRGRRLCQEGCALTQKKGFLSGLCSTHRVPTYHTLRAQGGRSFVSGADDARSSAPCPRMAAPAPRPCWGPTVPLEKGDELALGVRIPLDVALGHRQTGMTGKFLHVPQAAAHLGHTARGPRDEGPAARV